MKLVHKAAGIFHQCKTGELESDRKCCSYFWKKVSCKRCLKLRGKKEAEEILSRFEWTSNGKIGGRD